MDYSKIENIEIDGIDHSDYPDYVDAFISYAEYNGKEMNDCQLEELNENSDFVYDCVIKKIF